MFREKDPFAGSDVGLLFVRSEDPVSRLTVAISKQEFSSIGFYYRSSLGRNYRYNVVLIESFGLMAPEWSHPDYTVDDLLANPLINRVAFKPLIVTSDQQRLRTNFRTAIAKVLSEGPEISIRESLQQLFGQKVSSSSSHSLTNVDLVNRVILALGKSSQIPIRSEINSRVLALLEEQNQQIETTTEGKIRLLQLLVTPLLPNDSRFTSRSIGSYLADNGLFGELQDLSLATFNPVTIERAKKEAIVRCRPYLTKVITTFVDLLLTDSSFFAAVVGGVHRKQDLDFDQKRQNTQLAAWIQQQTRLGRTTVNLQELEDLFPTEPASYDLQNLAGMGLRELQDLAEIFDQIDISSCQVQDLHIRLIQEISRRGQVRGN